MLNKFLRGALVVSVSSLSVTAFAPAADAALLFTLQEQGNDVVGTLSGFLDVTGLTPIQTDGTLTTVPGIIPFQGRVRTFDGVSPIDRYLFDPSALVFGSGGIASASSVTFDNVTNPNSLEVAIGSFNNSIFLRDGYSGEDLGATLTFNNTDLATLGATPGTYSTVFNPNTDDTITYQIIPEPLTMLGASAAVAFGTAFKRRKAK